MANHRGQTLVLAYMAVVVLTVVGGSFLTHGLTTQRHSHIQKLETDVFYLAEGAIEDAIAEFAQGIANFAIDPNAPQYPTSGSITTTFSPSAAFPAGAVVYSVVTEAQPTQQVVIDPDGTSVLVKNYRITATVQHPSNGSTIAVLNQVILRRIISTFQHAVFYDNDLEWLPGPNMTLSGRVHSNADMYLGANNTLTVDSEYVHAAGSIYNRRKDNNTVPPGMVLIKQLGTSNFVAMAGLDSTSPNWATQSQTQWNGTVQTSVHGVTQLAVPVVGSTAPGGFYDTNANVKVVNNTMTQGGVPLVEGVNIPLGTVTSTTTMYNNREGKWVKMTELDLRKLAGYAPGDPSCCPSFANHIPSNGLLYATRSDALASQQPGIRLRNGQEIVRNGGLTVVSNDPLYIQGNFNTVVKKPVAVIGDAVNLLSNNWNDSNSSSSLSSRTATDTTVNSAFIAGIKTTTPGQYNGGLENYPRFHENWTNKTMTIRGSFVSLWNSQIATGNWQYGAPQYTAPIRNWHYETNFSSGTLPPFTPWAVEIRKGAWWKQ